jgi:hypothetical protein
MLNRRLSAAALAAALFSFLAPGARAQNISPEVAQALIDWRDDYGDEWHLIYNEITDLGRMLFGGKVPPPFTPSNPAEGFLLARYFIDEAYDILGVDTSTTYLLDDRWIYLPLGMTGSSDKINVSFRQANGGVPIQNAWVNVLFDTDANLLSIDSSYCPNTSSLVLQPSVDAGGAQGLAQLSFEAEFGQPAEVVTAPVLTIVPNDAPGDLPQLRWVVAMEGYDTDGLPVDKAYHVTAHGVAEVVHHEELVDHAVHEGGAGPKSVVKSRVTEDAGWLPDNGTNRVTTLVPHMDVVANTGETTVTDGNGEFTLSPPMSGPLTATLGFKGPFVEVLNDPHLGGPTVSVQRTISGALTTFPTNPAVSTFEEVSQANAFQRMNQTRDWVRSVNPFDDTLDSRSDVVQKPYRAYVNSSIGGILNPHIQNYPPSCLAVFRPQKNRIELSAAGTNVYGTYCPSAAFAPVIWHEFGHWLNRRYGMVIGGSAFNEGVADVWAMYQMDHPVVSYLATTRSGWNTRQYCGDCKDDQNCHPGGFHGNGLPLMGAMWKVRNALWGADPVMGGATADATFLGWMNAFNQDMIHAIIMYQWMVLDDDDGDITNGTPHFNQIRFGFVQNGFGPWTLPPTTVIKQTGCEPPTGGSGQ